MDICKLSVSAELLLLQCILCDAWCVADHDLTGQIVWPAAQVCNCFVIRNPYFYGTLTLTPGFENLGLWTSTPGPDHSPTVGFIA